MSADDERDRVVAWLRERSDVLRQPRYTLRQRLFMARLSLFKPHIVWCGCAIAAAEAVERNAHREARHD